MDNSQILNQMPDAVANGSDIVVSGAASVAQTSAMHDSSVFTMFWGAGFLIKTVIIALLISSIWSWTVMISKYFRLKKLNRESTYFEDNFWSGMPLESLYSELKETAFDPMSNIFCAAMSEWANFSSKYDSSNFTATQSLERRIDRVMQISIRKEVDDLEKGMGFLSSLGTNGVIVGLFGTVLGILNGFRAIGAQQHSSISTVAPVMAEALFTTALGIVVAIMAAVGYNKLMTDINRYVNRLETFADEFNSILSRQFDEQQ